MVEEGRRRTDGWLDTLLVALAPGGMLKAPRSNVLLLAVWRGGEELYVFGGVTGSFRGMLRGSARCGAGHGMGWHWWVWVVVWCETTTCGLFRRARLLVRDTLYGVPGVGSPISFAPCSIVDSRQLLFLNTGSKRSVCLLARVDDGRGLLHCTAQDRAEPTTVGRHTR